MKSPKEMAAAIADVMTGRGTPTTAAQVIDDLWGSQDLSRLANTYMGLFPEDLPVDVAAPNAGDLRYVAPVIEVWDGHAWRFYMTPRPASEK